MPSDPPPSSEPASDEPAPVVRLTVEGTTYALDLDEVAESAEPARVLWWAELLGRAERELVTAEAAYRHWRGAKTRAVSMAHPKRAEWRVRAEVDADAEMVERRLAVAEAQRAAVTLRAVVELLTRLV